MSEVPVPVFFLRKPIYLLLRHASQAVAPKQSLAAKVEWSTKLNGVAEALTRTEKPGIYFRGEEQRFVTKLELQFTYSYEIKEAAIQSVWVAINNYWAKNDTAGYRKDYSTTFNREVRISLLQTKVYAPFKKWIALDKKANAAPVIEDVMVRYAKAVCFMALAAASELADDLAISEADEINKIIEEIDYLSKADSRAEQEKIAEEYTNFWKTGASAGKNIPDIFRDSEWICYERTDGIAVENASWGIALSSIRIAETNLNTGYTPIEMQSAYVSGETCHKGVITLDLDSVHLVAHLSRESASLKTPAFFVMRLNYMTPDAHSLLIGYSLHYSVHYDSYLTKTVIWVKIKKNEHAQDKPEVDSLPLDLPNTDVRFNTIPLYIRQFLNNRLRNRLTMPSSYLTTTDTLDHRYSLAQWLYERNKYLSEDYLLRAYIGEYVICYYYGDYPDTAIVDYLRLDELTIAYDENAVEFNAKYVHKRNSLVADGSNDNDISQAVYTGIVRRSGSTIQLILSEVTEKVKSNDTRKAEANYIHISFSTPVLHSVAMHELREYEFFPGIVSGLNDSNNEPVSFRAAVVHREKLTNVAPPANTLLVASEYLDKYTLKKVIGYFENNAKSISIKVDSQNFSLSDRYPHLEALLRAGGSYRIYTQGTAYAMEIMYQDKQLEIIDENDFNALMKRADKAISEWPFA